MTEEEREPRISRPEPAPVDAPSLPPSSPPPIPAPDMPPVTHDPSEIEETNGDDEAEDEVVSPA